MKRLEKEFRISQSAATTSLSVSHEVPFPTSSSSLYLEERVGGHRPTCVSDSKETASVRNPASGVVDASSHRNTTTCTENKIEPTPSATIMFLKELLADCKDEYLSAFKETLTHSSDLISTTTNSSIRSSSASRQKVAAWIGAQEMSHGDTDTLHVPSKKELARPYMSESVADAAVSLEHPPAYSARLSSTSGDSSTSSSSECEVSAQENCFDFAPQLHARGMMGDSSIALYNVSAGGVNAHRGYTCPPRCEWGETTNSQFLI